MRKITLLLVMAISSICVFGATTHLQTRGMDINAFNNKYHNLTVEPIYGNLSSSEGMPFDLTQDDVKYSNTGSALTRGRAIAYWSLHTNFTPVDIKIKAENLVLTETFDGQIVDTPDKDKEIGYYLFLPYSFIAQDPEEISKTYTGYMKVKSVENGSDTEEVYSSVNDQVDQPISMTLQNNAGIDTGSFPIRFMLQEDASNKIGSYASGIYRADVTITVEESN